MRIPRVVVALGATLMSSSCVAMSSNYQLPFGFDNNALEITAAIKRVDVSIGVMSRCPDALYFENAFSKTLERVNQKINLSLYFIATTNSSSSFGATCKHGDEECQGNIHQLCVIDSLKPAKAGKRYDLGPSAAQRLWWEFVQCENFVGGRQRIGEESLAKQCLKAIGGIPDWQADGLENCAEGKKGRTLLKNSLKEAHKQGIKNSATLLIEGKAVCVRDDNQWKDCSAGHETVDWVRQIEEAYDYKNTPSKSEEQVYMGKYLPPTRILNKRQLSTPLGGAPAAPPNAGTSQGQGAPLSVFTPPNVKSSLLLQPRQSGGSSNNTLTPLTNNGTSSPFNAAFPVPYLAFGIAAIALFVLVVAFVLLRIFVRNRRLRRMGIYPEGPIDRLLGGNFREFEDNLPPPRLWEAKITDVATTGLGSEKSEMSTEKDSSYIKRHGWDALMPVSAALPPNLYPVIYQANEKINSSFEPPPVYPPPPSNQHTARIGRHMPQFLRRQTGDATEPISGAANPSPTATTNATDFASALAGGTADKAEDKLAASVNVTVLIAMPSSRTVFPSSRRVASTTSTTDPLGQPSAEVFTTDTKLQEVEEDSTADQDALALKGKARRAPSLRSVKSTTSFKSLGETRREAFFSQITKDDAGKDIPSDAIIATPAPAYEEEEEELPELMFGTASIPIFTRLGNTSTSRSGSLTLASHLLQPSRSDILALISAASKARERKVEVEAAVGAKMKKQDENDLEANRRSVAETSLDGEGRSATAGFNDRSDDDPLQTPMGDVTTRMFHSNDVEQSEDLEMTNMGPSRSYSTYSSDMPTPTTPMPILSMASPFGTPATTPTSSMPLAGGTRENGRI